MNKKRTTTNNNPAQSRSYSICQTKKPGDFAPGLTGKEALPADVILRLFKNEFVKSVFVLVFHTDKIHTCRINTQIKVQHFICCCITCKDYHTLHIRNFHFGSGWQSRNTEFP